MRKSRRAQHSDESATDTPIRAFWLPPDLRDKFSIDDTLLTALPHYKECGNMAQALQKVGLTQIQAFKRSAKDREKVTGLLAEIGDAAKFSEWMRPWINLERLQDVQPGTPLSNTARERLAEGIRADARVPDAPRQVQNTILVLDSGKLWGKVKQALATELASQALALPLPDNLDGSIEAEIVEDAPLDAVHKVAANKDE